MIKRFQVMFFFSVLLSACSSAQTPTLEKSFDNFPLTIAINKPSSFSDDQIQKVVIFAHGSGPQNLDGDLTSITTPKGTQNLFYRDISDALVRKGFATIRYNKRAYEVKLRLESDPNYRQTEEFKLFNAQPLKYFIQDLSFFADFAKARFPKAKVFLLGHSEGTKVVLNVAKGKPYIDGVTLIGFSNESIATSILEQTVYRNEHYFRELDRNRNGTIEGTEFLGSTETAKSLQQQLPVLDRNQDQKIDLSEYRAGNYANLVINDKLYIPGYIKDEADLPRSSSIIESAKFKILFLQGEWDNQTPAYHAQAIQLVNENIWKKENLRFCFFPKAGHALDPRTSIQDVNYRKASPATLERIAQEMDTLSSDR